MDRASMNEEGWKGEEEREPVSAIRGNFACKLVACRAMPKRTLIGAFRVGRLFER